MLPLRLKFQAKRIEKEAPVMSFVIGVFFFDKERRFEMFLKRIELQIVMVSDLSTPYDPIPDGVPEGLEIRRAEDVFRVFGFLSGRVQEEMYALYLNTRNRVIGFYMVSRGSLNKSIFSPADILRPALLLGSDSIILVHNHPSGNPDPSPEDLTVTERMIEACRLLGFTLHDHIIIGQGCFQSIISMVS